MRRKMKEIEKRIIELTKINEYYDTEPDETKR